MLALPPVASAWLPYQPMLPLQLLTQNLLYDFSQGSIPWYVLLLPFTPYSLLIPAEGITLTQSIWKHQERGAPCPLSDSWFASVRSRAHSTFLHSALTGEHHHSITHTLLQWSCYFRFHYKIRSLDSPLVPLAQTNWFLEGSLTQVRLPSHLLQHHHTSYQLAHM